MSFPKIWNFWIFMHITTYAMSTEFFYNRKAMFMCINFNRMRNIPNLISWFHHSNSCF